MELSHLEKIFDAQTPMSSPQSSTTIATKSSSTTKLTTRVTLNMRQFKRRLSDVGMTGVNDMKIDANSCHSPRMPDVRHSVCGSQIIGLSPKMTTQNFDTTSGRSFEQIRKYHPVNDPDASFAPTQSIDSQMQLNNFDVSRIKTNSSKVRITEINSNISLIKILFASLQQVQSIEDLYIDDDFQGVSLAANMKLFTSSNDTLDSINFDLISAHIYEETSQSTTTATMTNEPQSNLLSIEEAKDNSNVNAQN